MNVRMLILALAVGLFTGCTSKSPEKPPAEQTLTPAVHAGPPEKTPTGPVDAAFGDYWYQGKAELTSYKLEQARYGEIHAGHAVLIFVTEDFSRSKQVKLDDPAQAGDDAVKVMKLNFTRKFNTGIYPYSMMASIFTPVYRAKDPRTLKITATSQEWCGHTFTQLNLRDHAYRGHLYSYFEKESDQALALEEAVPEDELWITMRLNPDDLPTGAVRLIPGTLYQRFRHLPFKVYDATASLQPDEHAAGRRVYTVTYPDLDRTLAVAFNSAFPYEIESWKDSYPSGFGKRAVRLTTTAVRDKRMMIDYWTRNKVKDLALRRDLGLDWK